MNNCKYYKSKNGDSLFKVCNAVTYIYSNYRFHPQFSYPIGYIKSLTQLTEEELMLELL